MSQLLELLARRRAGKLADQAAANATQGGDPAALDATMGRRELDQPRVPREPTPDQLADRQFSQTPMHQFMQQRDEAGGMDSPTEWAGQQSGGGKLASGGGSGASKSQILQRLAIRNRLLNPQAPDPNVVAQARQKYADEAAGIANAAAGAYGGAPAPSPGGSAVLRMAGGFPVIDARGTGGPLRGRYRGNGSSPLSFDQRVMLESLRQQGKEREQGAITNRATRGIQSRESLYDRPSANAQLTSNTATANRTEDARQFDAAQQTRQQKFDQWLKHIKGTDLQEAQDSLNRAMAMKAKRAEEIKARTGRGILSPNDDVNGKPQPGYTKGLVAEQEIIDRMIAEAQALVKELSGAPAP